VRANLAIASLIIALAACSGQSGAPAATSDCGEVDIVPIQGGEHLIGDRPAPIPYNSTPPTSGWHASGAFTIAIHALNDPLPEAKQVSVLEAGGVVVTYRDLPDHERAGLEAHVREHYDGRVALTPYDELEPGTVAFTGWGVLQRCDAVDLAALDAFVDAYADERPATPGTQ
jgi:hypothetical protein